MSLSSSILEALNNQIANEGNASQFYLSVAYWCDDQALDGCKQFFMRQTEEERMHMMKIFEYISEAGGHPKTPGIEAPPIEFKDIQTVFQQVYEQEQFVTKSINDIVDLCYKESDYATLQFLQWYVEEQREEEANIRAIMDRIKVIGKGGQSLYYIDKEVNKFNDIALAEEPVEE